MRLVTNRHMMGFPLIILLMCVGSIAPIITYVALVLIVVIALWLGRFYSKNNSVDCCVGLILLIIFQNFAIGVGAHILENTDTSLRLLTQVPFITTAILWISVFLKRFGKFKFSKEECLFILLLVMILVSLVFGRGSFSAILMNLRNMTVFFMAYQIGYNNISDEKQLICFQRKILGFSVLLLIAGIILLIGGYELYTHIGMNEIYAAKGSPLSGRFDGRFYTTLIRKQYLRMGSLYYEPVNLGYYFSAALLVAWFGKWEKSKKEKFFYVCITTIGLILTFGKGGYLIVGVVVGCTYVYRIINRIRMQVTRKLLRNVIIIGMIVAVSVFCFLYVKYIGAAVLPHFWGITQTWESVVNKPWGYGFGTGGNMANTLTGQSLSFATGAETALMSYFYQVGIQGGLVFIASVLSLSLRPRKGTDKAYVMFCFVPFVLIVMSLLQDNTFTPQCILLFMIMQGGVKKIVVVREKEEI